jgi:hypothetical protein
MTTEIRRQLFSLNNLSLDQLKLKWQDIFKTSPPNYSRSLLIRELAYRIQTLYYPGLPSEEELKRLARAAKKELLNDDGSKKVRILPPPGTMIRKIYHGNEYIVKILAGDRIEYNGEIYRSLSALASKIAGVKWNGRQFFGLICRKSELETMGEDND